jgi:hypothetical protein
MRFYMIEDISKRVLSAIARMPDWLRCDLSSKDDATRQRAEESLAAMIETSAGDPVGA